ACRAPIRPRSIKALMRLAIIGDSITAGFGVPAGSSYAALLESRDLGSGNVLALGHNGATVRRWLPGGPWYGDLAQLAPFGPTDVLIALGMNEWNICRTTADYRAQRVWLAWGSSSPG